MYVCMYLLCMYECIYVCMYVCMFVCKYTNTSHSIDRINDDNKGCKIQGFCILWSQLQVHGFTRFIAPTYIRLWNV